MRTNSDLRKALLSYLGVTKQRLSQRVKKVKTQNGPMTTADATYVIAHQEGLDLTKYLDAAEVSHVRSLIRSGSNNATQGSHGRKSKEKTKSASATITLPREIPKVDVVLSTTLARDAQEMAKLYTVYYALENSMRVVITRVLEKSSGKAWWMECVPGHVQKNVSDRKQKESQKPWHGKRNAHNIYYSDFRDLRQIIEKNWSSFSVISPDRPWITNMLEQLEHPRNVMAHHNPVSKNDRKRVELYFDDWTKLLEAKKNVIP